MPTVLIYTGLSTNIASTPMEKVNLFTHVAGVGSQGTHKSIPKNDGLKGIVLPSFFNTGDIILGGFESSVLWYWL